MRKNKSQKPTAEQLEKIKKMKMIKVKSPTNEQMFSFREMTPDDMNLGQLAELREFDM